MMTTDDLIPTVMMTTHDRAPAMRRTGQAAMTAALRDFGRRYPAYAGTAVLDGMRAVDYTRLDAAGHVYLDYTGGALYAESQLARHRDLLAGAIFGNPHSANVGSPPPGRWLHARAASWRPRPRPAAAGSPAAAFWPAAPAPPAACSRSRPSPTSPVSSTP